MAHKHPIYDTDKHFVIDPITKKISTESPKLVLAQHSHNSERFTFELPQMIEGHDMSACNLVEIHFQNIEAVNKSNRFDSFHLIDDLQSGKGENEGKVFCSWLIPGDATQYVGGLIFALRFACVADDGTVEYNYPTLAYSNITVGESIWNSKTIAEKYPEILEQFYTRLALVEDGYYIPSVSQADKNTVEISFRGSKEGMTEVEKVTFALPSGPQGYSPVKGKDYFTEEDRTAMINELNALTDAEIEMLNTLLMDGSPACAPMIEATYRYYSQTSSFTYETTYFWNVSATIKDIAKSLVQKVEISPGSYSSTAPGRVTYNNYAEVTTSLGEVNHTASKLYTSRNGGQYQYGFAVRLTYYTPFGETKTLVKTAVKQ